MTKTFSFIIFFNIICELIIYIIDIIIIVSIIVLIIKILLLFFGTIDALIEEMEENIYIKHDSTEDSINSDLIDGSKSNSDLSSIDTKVDQLEECGQL